MANGGDVTFNFKGDDKNLNKTAKSATSMLKSLGETIGNVVKTGSIAFGTLFSTAVVSSVKARGEIEQTLGGINKLFKNNANEVVKNAQKAYKTAGISANQYMEQASSFSASLLQGLGGDTQKAVQIADKAIRDMADNANTFGTSVEMIQNAYQGFAKQNYTMLDNLKLGYGGTKSEMARLVKESGILGKAGEDLTAKNFDQKVSFDQIIEAIHKVQENMEITGTTSKEASDTLQGSVASFKASWNNLLSGMGSTKELIKSFKPLIKNVANIAKQAIAGIWGAIQELISEALAPLRNWIEEHKNLIIIITGVIATLTTAILACVIAQNSATIALGIYNGVVAIATTATSIFGAVIGFLTSPITLVILAIGALITIGVLLVKNWENVSTFLLNILEGIKEGIGKAIEAIKEFFIEMGKHIAEKVDAIKNKFEEFGNKFKEIATVKIPQLISNIGQFFSRLPGIIWNHLVNAFNKFVQFIANLLSKAKEGVSNVVNNIKNGFANLPEAMVNVGKNIVKGIANGIGNMAQWLFDKIKSFKDAVLNKFKAFFGIHSPSTLLRDQIGENLALGIGEGFVGEMGTVSKEMNKALATVGLGDMFELSPTLNRTTTANSNVNVTVYNNMETDFMGNLVNNIRTFSNGAKNDYNYGMA